MIKKILDRAIMDVNYTHEPIVIDLLKNSIETAWSALHGVVEGRFNDDYDVTQDSIRLRELAEDLRRAQEAWEASRQDAINDCEVDVLWSDGEGEHEATGVWVTETQFWTEDGEHLDEVKNKIRPANLKEDK